MEKKLMIVGIFVLLMLPFTALFDTIVWAITRPSCLGCGNLIEYIKTSSLTLFLFSSYLLGKQKK